MKRLLLVLLLSGTAFAQNVTRVAGFCSVSVNFTAALQTATIDNRFNACNSWTFAYSSNGFTALSIRVESAGIGALGVPGTFGAFAGTLVSGINPNTATTFAISTLTGYYPWVRVSLTSVTGSGTINGNLYGQLNQGSAGTAPSTPATLSSVVDTLDDSGTNDPRVLSDSLGNPMVNPVYNFLYNSDSVTWARQPNATAFINNNGVVVSPSTSALVVPLSYTTIGYVAPLLCNLRASVNLSASGSKEIIPEPAAGFVVRICHIDISMQSAVDLKLVDGTGADCATGPSDLTGLAKNVVTYVQDYGVGSPLPATATSAVCVNLSAAVVGGVTAVYTLTTW